MLTQITYPIENYNDFEDSFIQIKCGELKDSFFMVKYDIENNQVYVGLNSLLYFLEIYSLEIDLKNMKVYGNLDNKTIDVKFDSNEAFVMDNSIYANISSIQEKLNFKSISFDFSLLSLTLVANFPLPYEQREKSKIDRLRLDEENHQDNKIDMEMKSQLISPGFLKVNWSKYNLKKSTYNLDYEYGTQFLYGSLYLNGEFYPENKIEYGNLTYNDFWKGNDLVIGSFSMITPHFINLGSDVLGVSIRDEDTYMTRDGGITIIKGEAENAQIIELYRDFSLIDYLYPKSKNFEFRIVDGILNSDYTLKIYYNDGRVEDKNGTYIADGIASNKIVTISLNRKSVDPGYKNSDGKIKIKVRDSSSLKLDIPVQAISFLAGNIVLTKDFTEKQFVQNLSLITILLEQDGEVITETEPEFDGMYFFEDILPGKYTIKFNYLGYENVDFSNKSIDVEIKNSDDGEYFDGLDTEMIKGEKEEKN